MKKPQPRTTIAKPEEINSLLEMAKPGLRLQIMLCLDSALRYSEAAQIGPLNYSAEKRTAVVVVKGGNHAEVPISDRAANLIAVAHELTQPGQSYIEALSGMRNKASMRSQWTRLKKKLGIRTELHIHDLRRTTATRAYTLTKDLRTVQQLLNHEQLSSTLHYIAPLDPQKLRPLIHAIQIPRGRRIQ